MNLDEFIEYVGKKHDYDQKLVDALKRCVPRMLNGKNEEEKRLLFETLNRVKIYTFNSQPSLKQMNELLIKERKGRNSHVTISDTNNEGIPAAYESEPVFDEDMKIVDRIGYIYITNLPEDSETAMFYRTNIDLSLLIHELSHAWAAQKEEYLQEENKNFIKNVGAAKFYFEVDRQQRTVKEVVTKGVYLEEALNTVEEENVLYEVLGINSCEEIPKFIPHRYASSEIRKLCVNYFGEKMFNALRIRRDSRKFDEIQRLFKDTQFMLEAKQNRNKEWLDEKRKKAYDVDIKSVKTYFDKYDTVFFNNLDDMSMYEYLDNVLQQLFMIYDVKRECIKAHSSMNAKTTAYLDYYRNIHEMILAELAIPLTELKKMIDKKSNPFYRPPGGEEL